jgi:hypothetical protein
VYKLLAVYHSNIPNTKTYLDQCESKVCSSFSELSFETVDQTDSRYLRYINGDRYPVFIMYKNDIPYARLIGKVSINSLCSWIQKTFD